MADHTRKDDDLREALRLALDEQHRAAYLLGFGAAARFIAGTKEAAEPAEWPAIASQVAIDDVVKLTDETPEGSGLRAGLLVALGLDAKSPRG